MDTPTSTLRVDEQLTMAAARLGRAAPQEWRSFLDALLKYAVTRRDSCVVATLDTVQNAQGRAQQCSDLIILLEEAMTVADRIAAKRR
jgi:hypothetical protein